MYIEHRDVHRSHILNCCGRFDYSDRTQFMETVETLLTQGYRCLIVNFTSLYFLDPQIIPDLTFAYEYLRDCSVSFRLVSPLSYVRNELLAANIHQIIPIYATIYDALHRPHLTVSDSTHGAASKSIPPSIFSSWNTSIADKTTTHVNLEHQPSHI